MSQTETDRFRLMCRQFNWLAIFMVCSVGLLLLLMYVASPIAFMARGEARPPEFLNLWLAQAIKDLPQIFYLFAVWSIGAAMGQLAKGRLIQPVLAGALRRVGLALGFGGLLSVFGITNILRLINDGAGAWLYFDVAGMTLGMIGGALFLLGRVVEQAGRVQAELDEMI
ncbi:DUF2975 domain-containing protein [Brevundimonas sp. M20]|uniref:DUF2975 domain-containing protein n=1 Tax=Brevundimonas sp. M20 TaxID=2591463 RepID=UPI00143CFDFE|nr:DUF2975 domain-containing protein [Brevundimonas sp. M20]